MNQDQIESFSEGHDVPVRGDRWMAILAHELRNPLGAIMMSLEELRPICAADASACPARETAMASTAHGPRD